MAAVTEPVAAIMRDDTIAYPAYPRPAPSASATPPISTPPPRPPSVRIAQPATAAAVATIHRRVGRPPRVSQTSRPVKTGALPIVTTVPTATPVRATAEKKQSWYAATPAPPRTSAYGARRPRTDRRPRSARSSPRSAAMTSSVRPPNTMRAAPTDTGSAPAGASACAVPVVPHREAASSTSSGPLDVRADVTLLTCEDTRTLLVVSRNRATRQGRTRKSARGPGAHGREEGKPRRAPTGRAAEERRASTSWM